MQSITSFFSDPDNMRFLTHGQFLELANLQQRIDALNAQDLNDIDLANRDVQVRKLRDEMCAIADMAMEKAQPIIRPAVPKTTLIIGPRHMRKTTTN